MAIVGGLDIHRKQLTFDYLDQTSGEVKSGRIAPADRGHLAVWLRRFEGVEQVSFAAEACTGWRYVVECLQAAGVRAQLAEPADTAAARGRKRRAKTDRADSRLLRELVEGDRVPRCWIPPRQVLEHRALLELYHDLRREHTAWIQRIHAVCFHQGTEQLQELGTEAGRAPAAPDRRRAAVPGRATAGRHLPADARHAGNAAGRRAPAAAGGGPACARTQGAHRAALRRR